MAETIESVSLRVETEERYLNYAMSVIMSRALPDVRDGLKPVQRRILFTMYHDLHLTFDGRPRKCAKIIGDVTGNYHPHDGAAAYEALVRMAQNFVLRNPLVHGQGNFGSVDGDPPAAERYTEAKLAAVSESLLSELRQRTVSMRPNYENTREEPVVLPAQFPNLLVNGASGIAVGMATNIPPHNLGEVVKGCIHLIDNPEATTAQLHDKIKGPDFPLGGKVITDRAALRKIYEEGSGSIKVQGEWKVETIGKREQIVITSIPYGVDKGKLEESIGEIIASRMLPQLLNLVNESNEKEGLRIALEMKAGSDPNLILAYLYKHTQLQDNFAYNLTCLVPVADEEGKERTRPERLGLKAILRHFLDFRLATVRRRFEYELEQLRRRIHILEGFRIIFNALDKAIKIIRDSDGKADASQRLISTFKLDEEQAAAILDAQLYKIAQLEIKKILDELKEKTAQAEKIESILRSEKKLWGVIKDELNELSEKYGSKDRRRTRMGSSDDAPEFDPEAYIVRENTNVVLTRDGWIKRVGRLASVEGTRVREGDEVLAVVPGSTLDHVVFFADDGTSYTMRISEVPASSGYGEPIVKFFRLADQVRIVGIVTTDERFTPPDHPVSNGEPAGPYLLVATIQGQVLRTPLAPFRTASTKVGRRYVRLAEGDKVVLATVLKPEHRSLFLASANGHVLHFPVEEINILAGVGKGVIGIKLGDGDTCLGGAVVRNQNDAMVVETSGGKQMEFYGSRDMASRGGKGFEAVKRTSFVRIVLPAIELVDWDKVEGRAEDRNGKVETNGEQKSLFE
ncbi:MAG TPA: DNA topoisomerase IV subunit A [Gemmataceae bacterium]|nr:DNA topoisomerase IV subunit A [Gemmataceae bacterium]